MILSIQKLTKQLSCIISEVCFAQNSSSAISLLIDHAKKEDYAMLTCNNCKSRMQLDANEIANSSNVQLVLIDRPESTDKPKKQILKVIAMISAAFSGITYIQSIIFHFFLL